MITDCQRWREGSSCLRPAREIVSTRNLEVVEVVDDATPKAFIELHHYSRTYPAAQRRIALVQSGALAGFAIFSRPFREETLTNAFPLLGANEATELGRFVLLDDVGANAETWFLARAFEIIRDQFRGVVSFSDPEPRATIDGRQIFPGHYGCIYQAANANYRGLTEPKTKWILPDGTEFSNFANGKIRRGLTGWRSAVGELVRFGATPLTSIDDEDERIAWLEHWRGRLTRPVRHRGQHRYTFALDREMPKIYGPARAYPKRRAA